MLHYIHMFICRNTHGNTKPRTSRTRCDPAALWHSTLSVTQSGASLLVSTEHHVVSWLISITFQDKSTVWMNMKEQQIMGTVIDEMGTCLKQKSSVHPVPLDITEVVVSFLVELTICSRTQMWRRNVVLQRDVYLGQTF